MHSFNDDMETLAKAVMQYSLDRMRMDPPPMDAPATEVELESKAGQTVTEAGLGGTEALRVFSDVLAPACLSVDHPRLLAFVPAAPTEASILFDLVVGASSIYAGSWLEGAGAVYAENQALRWIADLAGFPTGAGGVFVAGGTAGNLSALVAARHQWRDRSGLGKTRGLVISSAGAHASIAQATRVMDADIVTVPGHRLTGAGVAETIAQLDPDDRARLFAVASTAGTTNIGIIDDLEGIADVCERESLWFHVDGAYGGAGLAAPSVRAQFNGIERADSFIVDPHKWLFAPFDCCALIYRDPETGRRAHRQHGDYLEVLYGGIWNPSDYAHHLSRRARGLPLWFSLATHGTKAYSDAVETTLSVARAAASLVQDHPNLELVVEQCLSIVMFRRKGWTPEDYQAWSNDLMRRGEAFVTPTKHEGETVLRFCVVNPRTRVEDIEFILDSLR
ncbi:L-2,4-diaminobutyrate decarboxylase [Luminiphilus syltensis NOR5-1B]|uniref:L-2,4-diaminobutyrate decarboxylase n=1 Tax=Luminiphilus syltensis NOR5-1B TaxID=565045 RepID=B8KSB8_9GAMM|nr:aminotransferase class V-fold PLP-dependent enzyme [Luminiphilus syltensis]EED34787.1 L-2,4-diaminobutyrate decarboxylase [Luminiphilus syltensis NOR5-1B]